MVGDLSGVQYRDGSHTHQRDWLWQQHIVSLQHISLLLHILTVYQRVLKSLIIFFIFILIRILLVELVYELQMVIRDFLYSHIIGSDSISYLLIFTDYVTMDIGFNSIWDNIGSRIQSNDGMLSNI